MAMGIIIMGLDFLFMVFLLCNLEESGSSSMIWLVMAYLFHTIGELCISPVALSFITKLSPVKYASLMMGVYFCCDWIGNKVAGIMGSCC
jgi:POT family proton-dependent oligopeptide transporter